jgi:hypothetical protein
MSVVTRPYLSATLLVAAALVLTACGSSAPAATAVASVTPGATSAPVTVGPATFAATTVAPTVAQATAPPPTVIETTPGPIETPPADTPAPANVTTFHLVIADGPKEGTWDATDESPTACNYVAELDKWNVSHLGPAPLSFIDAGLSADLPILLVSFDSQSPNAVRIRSIGDVTYEVDDRGDTATIDLVSEENEADFDDGSPSEEFGEMALTVECAAPFRYT